MANPSLSVAALGLAAFASPAWAQEFYVGAGLGTGEIDFSPEGAGDHVSAVQSVSVLAGVRFDVGSNFFLGAEVQSSHGTGYDEDYPNDGIGSGGAINQAEIHFGYDGGSNRFFGFVGTGNLTFDDMGYIDDLSGPTVFGVGAEFGVTDRMSIRVETEFSTMSIDDDCSSFIGDVEKQDVSAGVVFSF